jgi:murein DD-endopeptidase MepM/ murein hydrolase activator NlpD
MSNDPGQFKRASYMTLGGVALILVVSLIDYNADAATGGMVPMPLPDASQSLRLKAAADSIRTDSIRTDSIRTDSITRIARAGVASMKSSVVRPRITLRDSAASLAASRRVADAVEELRRREVMVPIPGLAPDRLRDSFNQWRSNGTRRHNAIDLLAPRGTPILAADSGTILKMNRSALGGIAVYASDPHRRFVYYYAHLDAYHPALDEGMTVARGDTIGFVGSTGNAPPGSPHLHFAIFRTDDVDRWYAGIPINPRDVFRPR